ncbi:hypothetical protein TNCT_496171 [Trichonephila clavata]|uniref:Uncharacterized protein n=1 Tax=Trichonephila clavata TaxID=2740835 RepID=A0A8X6GZN8_TRICU|nr:hypothetical protein TNCT_496171 [Trichonephila clavata]
MSSNLDTDCWEGYGRSHFVWIITGPMIGALGSGHVLVYNTSEQAYQSRLCAISSSLLKQYETLMHNNSSDEEGELAAENQEPAEDLRKVVPSSSQHYLKHNHCPPRR